MNKIDTDMPTDIDVKLILAAGIVKSDSKFSISCLRINVRQIFLNVNETWNTYLGFCG